MHLYILGRQPKLGLLELERICGAENVQPFGDFAALVENSDVDFSRLGGSVKKVEVIHEKAYKNPGNLYSFLIKNAGELFDLVETGRHTLGVSVFGAKMPVKKLNALMLSVKKQLKTDERSIRIVQLKNEQFLSSAEVIHNKLLQENGRELVVAVSENKIIFGITQNEQDIESYTRRDRQRPMRDMKVGMLPPKLAQIMVNLSVGRWGLVDGSWDKKNNIDPKKPNPHLPSTNCQLLDPFCGTGVLLQEAALMGLRVYGSDIDERMVRYSRDNLQWLKESFSLEFDWHLEQADATKKTWQQPINYVAGETYLGRPLSAAPPEKELQEIIEYCDDLHRKFLQNLASQLQPGTSLCLAVPAWRVNGKTFYLPFLDDLSSLGYNQIDFKHAEQEDLIYFRENQIVARKLLVLKTK